MTKTAGWLAGTAAPAAVLTGLAAAFVAALPGTASGSPVAGARWYVAGISGGGGATLTFSQSVSQPGLSRAHSPGKPAVAADPATGSLRLPGRRP
jgi:hypothetical protein